ncbi:uncharacterized protein LAJ45_00349 [Morchella importuna]|uniref:PH domain-containing protein n=1 Tax=Morchella conica CCBAS932 TaxID=1392247 RepID=A0A3N4KJA3_9PEZI|nr:uncharacterized protein LAJ45_00349 [Morchella importuna]KAH8155339.1 hypothetical protein LAJ45_00349 [Morchella importuna]RPB10637.1 hypothetical protein P167DRAFT_537551 [Morchella conica CCBAS932]
MLERGHGYNRNTGIPLDGNATSSYYYNNSSSNININSSSSSNNHRTSFMATPPLAPLGMEPAENHHHPHHHHSNSTSNSTSNSSSSHHHSSSSSRPQKGFFSLFSRFGVKNRSLSRINTKSSDFPRFEASGNHSVPSTPITPMAPTTPHPHVKHSLSLPVFSSRHIASQIATTIDHSPLSPTQRTWEHIPYWMAATRAIRSGSLAATTLSMETILRRNQEQKEEGTRSRRGRILQRSHASTKSVDLDWTTKMFILVEGSLLQYGGDGSEDREPEKVLQLTESSVAFASDLIPGRPWVLQVYQSAGPDGNLPMPERRGSFLSKMPTFSHKTSKNSTASLLLVFNGAEEMDAWMSSIRAEAIRLGGGVPDQERGDTEDIEEEAEETDVEDNENTYIHARRYMENEGDSSRNESSDETASKRLSNSTYYRRSSTEAGRSFTTVVSGDQLVLDQLRGSRLSMQSIADTKVSTISPDTSPDRSNSTRNKRKSTASVSARSRSSMELKPSSLRPLSAIDRDGNLYWIPRTPSPSAPNFSLPTALSTTHIQQQPARRSPMVASQPIAIPHNPTPPLSNRPSLSALSIVDSLPDSPPYPLPRQRHRQASHSTPASPRVASGPSRPRPVSMVDPRLATPEVTITKAPTLPMLIKKHHSQAGIALTTRTKSLRRKSMTAIGPADGPPLHPPPSIPLPQLPPEPYDDLYSSSLPSTSFLGGRRLPASPFMQAPKPPSATPYAFRSLGSRHSFHGVRKGERYV